MRQLVIVIALLFATTIARAQTLGIAINKDTSLQGTGSVSSPLGVNTANIQARVSGTCSAGSAMREIASNGTVTCEAFASAASISGTTNTLAKFTSTTSVGNSQVTDDGTTITFGAADTRVTTVDNTGLLTIRHDDNGLQRKLVLDNRGITGAGQGAGINFGLAAGAAAAAPAVSFDALAENATHAGATADGTLSIKIAENATLVERLKITSAGLAELTGSLGISDTSPTEGRLVVGAGSSSEAVVIKAGSGWADLKLWAASTNGGSIYWSDDSGSTNAGEIFYYHVADSMEFKTATTTKMLIDSSGQVGINDTTPTTRLDVGGSIRSTVSSGAAALVAGTSSKQWTIYPLGSDLRFFEYSTTLDAGGGNDRVAFEAGGFVGIGVADPAVRLHVRDGNSTLTPNSGSVVVIEQTGADSTIGMINNTNDQGMLFGNGTSVADGRFIYTTGRAFTFYTANALKFTIASDGDLDVDSDGPHKFGGTSDGYVYITGDEINFHFADNSEQTGFVNHHAYNGLQTQFRNLQISDGKGSEVALFTGSTKALRVQGPLTVNGTSTHNADFVAGDATGDTHTFTGRARFLGDAATNGVGIELRSGSTLNLNDSGNAASGTISATSANNLSIAAPNASGQVIVSATGGLSANGPLITSSTSSTAIQVASTMFTVDGSSGNTSIAGTLGVAANATLGDATTDTATIWGHKTTRGTAPALSSCGTTPTITGTDQAGRFATGTGGTTCTLTFSRTYTSVPACVIFRDGNATGPVCSTSATAITCTTTVASTTYNYICSCNDASCT